MLLLLYIWYLMTICCQKPFHSNLNCHVLDKIPLVYLCKLHVFLIDTDNWWLWQMKNTVIKLASWLWGHACIVCNMCDHSCILLCTTLATWSLSGWHHVEMEAACVHSLACCHWQRSKVWLRSCDVFCKILADQSAEWALHKSLKMLVCMHAIHAIGGSCISLMPGLQDMLVIVHHSFGGLLRHDMRNQQLLYTHSNETSSGSRHTSEHANKTLAIPLSQVTYKRRAAIQRTNNVFKNFLHPNWNPLPWAQATRSVLFPCQLGPLLLSPLPLQTLSCHILAWFLP